MATFAELLVRIGGDATGFTTAMGTVSAQLDKTFTDAQKKIAGFDKLGASLTSIGTHVTAGLTLPIAAVGIAATKMAADFELGMRKVTSLLGGATQQEFKALSDQTLELSRRLGVDAVNAADGLYMAISSGIPKENALTFLEIASKAAIAGLTDTRVAVDGMTTILQAFGLQTSETQKVADAMFQAVNLGKMEFPELAASIGLAAGSAKALGVSYQELLAAGATLTNTTGQKIPEAMTMLQSAMKAVIEPTADMQRLIKALGYESGVALIKAKGLEGGLQAISGAAGGSIEVLAAAFGRVEGLRATLGITGDNAKRAASDLDGLKNSAGAATKAFEEIDKSTARQFTRLTTELKGISIELGTALLPAVNSLLSSVKPMIGLAADAVRTFTALPQPIQQTAVGLVALAAALGPAIYLTGNLVTGFGALSKALIIIAPQLVALGTSLKTVSAYAAGDLVTALTKGETALLSFLKVARLAAIPIVVGTVVYLALDKLNEYGTKLDQTAEKIKELNKRQTESGALAAQLTHGEVAHSAAVTKTAAAYESLMGFMKNMKPATSVAKPPTEAEIKAASDYAKELENALNLFGLTSKKSTELHNALGLVTRQFQSGKLSAEQYSQALTKYWQELAREVDYVQTRTLAEAALEKGIDRQTQAQELAIAAVLKMQDASQDWGQQLEYHRSKVDDLTVSLHGAYLEMNKVATQQLEVDWSKAAGGTTLETAMDPNGSIALRREAEAAGQYALRVREMWQAGKATQEDYMRAQDAATKASERASGVTESHTRKIREQRSALQDLGRAIEGIARNWAVDIGRGLWDTILGKGRKEFNANLDEQTADLNASLAERAADWAAYQQDIEAGYAAARQKYQDTLAEGEADLAASLAERTKDYADAEAENAATLVAVRDEYAKELAGTLSDLSASLEERRGEYYEYVADINDSLQETRREHYDQLAGQLSDLEESLDDQRRSYSEYVDDVNKKLSRIGEDYAESIDDETKSVKAGIDDKQQEYKRDEEDILERIKRLKKAGKTEQDEEVQDLRKSLRRKQEDLAEYVREAGEKLAEFTSDAKRRNDREESDLKESLAERTAEWTRYQAENAAKRTEAIAKNAADLAKDEADLAKSLANRTADWVKYQADNAAKVEAAHTKYTEGLAEEEADLAASLAKKKQSLDDYVADANEKWVKIQASALASLTKEEADLEASLAKRQSEYDAYVTDTQTKLDALVEMHRTAWDDIGDVMVSAFERAGESLMTFVTDYLMGSLLDSIKKGGSLWSAIEGLGKKIVDIFTGASNAVSTIPGLPGRIPGGSTTVTNPPIPGAPVPPGGGTAGGGGSGGSIFDALSLGLDIGNTIVGWFKEGTWGSVEENTHFINLGVNTLIGQTDKARVELITTAANSFVTASTLAAMRNDFQTGAYKVGFGGLNYTDVLEEVRGILDNIRSDISRLVNGAVQLVGGGTSVIQPGPVAPVAPGRNVQAELDAAIRDLEASRIGANIAASSNAFADELAKLLSGDVGDAGTEAYLKHLSDLAAQLKESGALSADYDGLSTAIAAMIEAGSTGPGVRAVEDLERQLRETGNTFEDWAVKVSENSRAVDRLTEELAGGVKAVLSEPTVTAPGAEPISSTTAPPQSLVQSLFNLAAVVAKKPSEQYGSADWLTGMLARQEATLANAVKGYDPNNPLGKEDWAAAYAANTGPAYQEWLSGAITSTKGMLEQWATWARAVAEQARATTAAAARPVTVILEGGSVRDQEFASMVIDRYTRQLKAGGLL